jgi:hypothetical protein
VDDRKGMEGGKEVGDRAADVDAEQKGWHLTSG